MFPSIDKNMKQKDSGYSTPVQNYDKILADNTSRMVEILQSVVQSNEHLNDKTNRLVSVTQQMVLISQHMLKISDQMKTINQQNVKWLKRLDKRMYYMNQNITGQPVFQGRQHRIVEKSIEKEHGSPRKDQNKLETNDPRIKMFDLTPHQMPLIKRQSDLNQSSRIIIPFSSQYFLQIKNQTVEMQFIKTQLATWVGELYRQITQYIYSRYINAIYSQEQARLIFCQNVILNNISLMNYFRQINKTFWNTHRYQLLNYISTCSKKILGFLKVKVPRNKKNFKSLQFENMVQRINNSQDPRYDILKNSKIWFEVKKDKQIHYIRQIKLLFNSLIENVEAEYPVFNKTMARIFNGGDEINSKVKYLIGKKFKDNIPKFSQQQLNTLSFKCKSPQILRILIKWLQEMEELIKNPAEFLQKKKVFKNYELEKKDPVPISQKIKKLIIKQIEKGTQYHKDNFQKTKNILNDLIDNVSQLISIKPKASEFLDHQDIKAIKFSQLISQSLPFLAVTRIQMIVQVCHNLQKIQKQQNFQKTQNLQNKKKQSGLLPMVDLLTFSVFDLLRCKCIGNKLQIQSIYKRIVEQKYFQLIRVKNRLDTPLNDILINCRIKNSPLICEIQLLMTNDQITDKSERNQHFNHFLYQLERSKFGPLCEACIIINDSDPRMQYIDELKKIKMKMPSITQQQQNKLILSDSNKKCYNNHPLKNLHFSNPFICTLCSNFYKQYSSTFDSFLCEECNLVICPSCFLGRLKQSQRKDKFLLKGISFRRQFYKQNIIELKNQPNEKLSKIVTDILVKNKSTYCMIISYTQGIITKKGYKLIGDTIFPTYFTLIKKPAQLNTFNKYDVLVLLQQEKIKNYPIKFLIKTGDIQFTNSSINREIIEDFATKQVCNLKCIEDDNAILIVDIDQKSQEIEKVMRQQELQKKIKQCKNSRITTLNVSSSSLDNIDLLKNYANSLEHVLMVVADQNQLTRLEPFWQLPNLRKLSLKDNKIKDYQRIDIKNQDFIDLFLAANKFESFPQIIAQKMTRISFKKNKISNLDRLQSSQLPLLQELGLAYNQITTLPLMNLPAIKKISLNNNKISQIQILNRSSIKTVQTLDLEKNQIENIPQLDLPSLKQLELGINHIYDISNLTKSILKSLVLLDLKNNKISEFPKQLKLDKLKTLNVSNNQITTITNITNQQFPNLNELNLSWNKLQSICCLNFPKISKLDLSHNQISKLSEKINDQDSYFFDSNMPNISSLSLALTNKFIVQQVILMEMDRWFTNIKYLE